MRPGGGREAAETLEEEGGLASDPGQLSCLWDLESLHV